MKYRYEIQGEGIHVRLYAITEEELAGFREDTDRMYQRMYEYFYDAEDPGCEYIGAASDASITIYDENDNEVLNRCLYDLENCGDSINEQEKNVKDKMCFVYVLNEEGHYGGEEFELDEPFDPEKLAVSTTSVDEIIDMADFVLDGVFYGEKKLPYEFDADTSVDQEYLGVAHFNEYVQAVKWLIDLGENVSDQ